MPFGFVVWALALDFAGVEVDFGRLDFGLLEDELWTLI